MLENTKTRKLTSFVRFGSHFALPRSDLRQIHCVSVVSATAGKGGLSLGLCSLAKAPRAAFMKRLLRCLRNRIPEKVGGIQGGAPGLL
jgi:hypothetical protein